MVKFNSLRACLDDLDDVLLLVNSIENFEEREDVLNCLSTYIALLTFLQWSDNFHTKYPNEHIVEHKRKHNCIDREASTYDAMELWLHDNVPHQQIELSTWQETNDMINIVSITFYFRFKFLKLLITLMGKLIVHVL